MKSRITTVLALCTLGSLAWGQVKAQPASDPIGDRPASILPLRFTVAGLTRENLAGVKSSLVDLKFQAYVCDPCKVMQAVAGSCPKCSMALKMAEKPLLVDASPSVEEGSIALTLDQGRLTRFSQIEGALKKFAISVDSAKLPLPGTMDLVVKGGSADKVASLEKALADAKLFDEAHATFDAASSEIRVHARSGAAPTTRAKLAALLESQKLQLGDVVFGLVAKRG